MARNPPIPDQQEGFDPATDFPSEPFRFPAETLNTFKLMLGVSESEFEKSVLPELNAIAASYRRSVFQTLATPRRAEINKALERLAADAKAFAQRLRSLEDDVLFEVDTRFEPAPEVETEAMPRPSRRQALASELDDLGRAMRRAHKLRRGQTGPEKNYDLALAVSMLADIYERTTGEPVRHNPSRKMEYQRKPQTPAGEFMLEFFTQVDPRKANKEWATDSAVSTALANHVRHRNRTRQNREVPPSETG